jgi:hypothetical protein
MKNISVRINNLVIKDKKISLKRGGPYYFIRQIPTKIDGKEKVGLEYQISQRNKKRVTVELIEAVYSFRIQNGRIPERFELIETFNSELKSRPCNYSVAKFIVEQLVKQDEKNNC